MTNVFILILFLNGGGNGGGAGGITTIEFPTAQACHQAVLSVRTMRSYQDAICVYSRTGEHL